MGSVNIFPKNKLLISVKVESGARGPIGLTPQLTIQETITLDHRQNANVIIDGTALTFQIPRGAPFDIAVEYPTVNDLLTGQNPIPTNYFPTVQDNLFDLAIITSPQGVEDPDNARLYIFDPGAQNAEGLGWSFVSDLSGATGPVRELRFRPGTSILEWRANDGINWIEGKDLALDFQFDVDQNDQVILTITNSDGTNSETVNLTATAEFGPGGEGEPTSTSVRFRNNNDTLSDFRELGVYADWNNTELILTNPNGNTVEQELALDFNWSNTTLQIKNPTEENYDVINQQKLSPDITSNGSGAIFIGEPGETQNLLKLSPNIEFRNIGNGLELSIIEPQSSTPVFNKISPDIYFQGTAIAIVEPGVQPQPGDFVDLKGETGDAAEAGTALFKIRDEIDEVDNGFLVTVGGELKFQGSEGIEVLRDQGVYSFTLKEVDGGDF